LKAEADPDLQIVPRSHAERRAGSTLWPRRYVGSPLHEISTPGTDERGCQATHPAARRMMRGERRSVQLRMTSVGHGIRARSGQSRHKEQSFSRASHKECCSPSQQIRPPASGRHSPWQDLCLRSIDRNLGRIEPTKMHGQTSEAVGPRTRGLRARAGGATRCGGAEWPSPSWRLKKATSGQS
jgi:hypothetical protein